MPKIPPETTQHNGKTEICFRNHKRVKKEIYPVSEELLVKMRCNLPPQVENPIVSPLARRPDGYATHSRNEVADNSLGGLTPRHVKSSRKTTSRHSKLLKNAKN